MAGRARKGQDWLEGRGQLIVAGAVAGPADYRLALKASAEGRPETAMGILHADLALLTAAHQAGDCALDLEAGGRVRIDIKGLSGGTAQVVVTDPLPGA